MTAAYPLSWPEQFPRTTHREKGQFKTALPAAIKNVQSSLRLFASDSRKPLQNLVISSNVTLGVDAPADPGVAVWFVWDGIQVCIPVDRDSSVASNLQAIHHIIEARRVELRHGTLALVRATFQGFIALPSPAGTRKRPWREVLNLVGETNPIREQVEHHYKIRAKTAHPDTGGSHEAMAELNRARDEALKEIGNA